MSSWPKAVGKREDVARQWGSDLTVRGMMLKEREYGHFQETYMNTT